MGYWEYDFFAFLCFFFNDTATTEIYTLSLHDALPISGPDAGGVPAGIPVAEEFSLRNTRSEEHTSELQSRVDIVCRLLLEKKKNEHLFNPNLNPKSKHDPSPPIRITS